MALLHLGHNRSAFHRRSRLGSLNISLVSKPPMLKRNMATTSLQTVVLDPKTKHSGTVIFLHGLGDTAYGWLPVMQSLQPKTPHVKYILPTAPMRAVTINSGMRMPAWYDITELSDRISEDFDGLDDTRQQILDIIESEIKQGLPANRIVLGGFSQGGASALYTAYSYNKPLAGVLGLSCYLPNLANFPNTLTPAAKNTECLMCHGKEDAVVLHEWGYASHEALVKAGIKAQFLSYAGMPHSASDEEIEDVLEFIEKALRPLGKL